jgi:hypothetical protein
MTRTLVGCTLAAVGAVVVLLSLLVDPLGVTIGDSGYGWEEALGAMLGAVMLMVGLALAVVEPGRTRTPLSH